ncbi:MAG: HEAT repeat domain-containing protein [Bacteroidota bacterium]
MKIVRIVSGIIIMLMLAGIGALYFLIDLDVKRNIRTAQDKYPGKAEDALIAYLLDTANTPYDRTHIGVWTLGQIKSEKAAPVLEQLYKNDPEGTTFKGKHDSVLCQYELYKALHASQVNWLPLHARLNR